MELLDHEVTIEEVEVFAHRMSEANFDMSDFDNDQLACLIAIAVGASKAVDALEDLLDSLRMHGNRDVVPGWVCVPEVEWDSVMARKG